MLVDAGLNVVVESGGKLCILCFVWAFVSFAISLNLTYTHH